jgi:hypothetical protein
MPVEYIQGAELPDVAITWTDAETGLIDFSTGWTFSARIGTPGATALLTKTLGITGAAIAPNVMIAWAADELDALAPGSYTVDVQARHTATNKDRKRSFILTLDPSVLASP